MAKRLIDGEWRRGLHPGFGLRSRLMKIQYPTKREYNKRMKKERRKEGKLELMHDANGKPYMGRRD